MSEYDLPVPDDAPWLNLSKEEIQELRTKKHKLTEYGKQKLKKLMNHQAPNGDYIKNYPLINRVEVITNKGREFVRYGCFNVQVSEQDEGRTLKVFLS